MSKIDYDDCLDLAKEVLGYTPEEGDAVSESDIEQDLYDKYGFPSFEEFMDLVEKLLPLCDTARSELTGKRYRGFGKDGLFLVKMEVKGE